MLANELTPEQRQERTEKLRQMRLAKKKLQKQADVVKSAETAPSQATDSPATGELQAKLPSGRVRRKGAFNGTAQKLDIHGNDPSYHYHIFNDTPGRIELAQSAGYEFVKSSEVELSKSTKVSDKNSDLGSNIRFIVGELQNQPLYAYLMKIPKEYFEEDQQLIQDEIYRREQSYMSRGADSAEVSNAYVPNGRKNALEITQSVGRFK